MLTYIVHDPSLASALRAEVAPGVVNNTLDIHHLMNNCPRLEACLYEVLRLTASSASLRYVQKPTIIGGKTLRPGNKIIMPYRQLHYNEDEYGSTTFQFDPERFLKDKDLSHSPSFRPFGGGSTYCPGRFIARQEVVTFVALVLYRFDFELANGKDVKGARAVPSFPDLEEGKPCLGVMGPAGGNDVFLRVKPSGR